MILIILLYAIFASTFTLGKEALKFSTPIFLVGARMTIAGAILLTYYWYSGQKFKFQRKNIWLYIQGALFTVYIPYILRFLAFREITASKASLLFNVGPFISYMLAYSFGQETVTWKKTLGLFIGLAGLIPSLVEPAPLEDLIGGFGYFSWPELEIIVAVSTLSYGYIVMHQLVKTQRYSPIMINGFNMFAGGVLALITALLFENIYITDQTSFWAMMFIIIIVSNLICHNLYGFLLKKHSPTMLSFAGFMTPFFTAFYSWLASGEMVTTGFMMSAVTVFIGLGIFYSEELKTNPELP